MWQKLSGVQQMFATQNKWLHANPHFAMRQLTGGNLAHCGSTLAQLPLLRCCLHVSAGKLCFENVSWRLKTRLQYIKAQPSGEYEER